MIAFNAALVIKANPIEIGLAVALGSASAKLIHYIVTFYVQSLLPEKQKRNLKATGARLKRYAFLGVFVAAATPIPDDPIIIPLGLMHYSPTRLFLAHFAGKLLIGSAGAYLGNVGFEYSSAFLTPEGSVVVSVILTLVLTIILLKTDTEELLEKAASRLGVHLDDS